MTTPIKISYVKHRSFQQPLRLVNCIQDANRTKGPVLLLAAIPLPYKVEYLFETGAYRALTHICPCSKFLLTFKKAVTK